MSDDSHGTRRGARLGRGLSSLLGEDGDDLAQLDRLRQSRNVPIEQISPGPYQPRRQFDQEALAALADSIRERGVLQPILLRRDPEGEGFQIVAGERRWRAAQLAQLHEVPALIRELADDEALEIALIENIQRSDLTPLEEAEAFRRLVDEHGHTQEAVAQAVGKSRSHVANTMRLLALPDSVKQQLDAGNLSAGHARALLGAEDPAALAEEVIRRRLNVRQTERLVQESQAGGGPARADRPRREGRRQAKDPDIRALEEELTSHLGLRIEVETDEPDGPGRLIVHYDSLEQLDDILSRLSKQTVHADPGEAVGADPLDDFEALLAQTEALLTANGGATDGSAGSDSADHDPESEDYAVEPADDDSSEAGKKLAISQDSAAAPSEDDWADPRDDQGADQDIVVLDDSDDGVQPPRRQ